MSVMTHHPIPNALLMVESIVVLTQQVVLAKLMLPININTLKEVVDGFKIN
jgi:hypothetical protein